MSVDTHFWIKAWKEGRTAFHQGVYNDKLTEYFPRLNPKKEQKVLVPLCGKTKDLLWLHDLSLHVHGIELHEQAVESFFEENKLSPLEKSKDPHFSHYTHKNIVISCGDFFKLNKNEAYDFIYDRAALVALPPDMRKSYAQMLTRCLKKGGKYLLISYEYDPTKMEPPPFSVGAKEIQELYQDQFTVKLMESKRPTVDGPRLLSLESLQQQVYILEKNY